MKPLPTDINVPTHDTIDGEVVFGPRTEHEFLLIEALRESQAEVANTEKRILEETARGFLIVGYAKYLESHLAYRQKEDERRANAREQGKRSRSSSPEWPRVVSEEEFCDDIRGGLEAEVERVTAENLKTGKLDAAKIRELQVVARAMMDWIDARKAEQARIKKERLAGESAEWARERKEWAKAKAEAKAAKKLRLSMRY